MTPAESPPDPVLLYDGSCAFCNGSVQFILAHERQHVLRFASLDSPYGQRCLKSFPELQQLDSMIWTEVGSDGRSERVHSRSAAGLRIARYLGGLWPLFTVFWLVPRPIRDWVYDLIAKHRHKIVQADACVVFPPEVQQRILHD